MVELEWWEDIPVSICLSMIWTEGEATDSLAELCLMLRVSHHNLQLGFIVCESASDAVEAVPFFFKVSAHFGFDPETNQDCN